MLSACGWPGEPPLGFEEQAVRIRFDALLGEFARMGASAAALRLDEAYLCLQRLAERTGAESTCADCAITLTASLDDPVAYYDGIWVAGLSADTWPPAANPDPFIPWELQQSAGVPAASAEAQLRLARVALQRWRQRTSLCVFSWARNDEDTPGIMSPLLRELPQTDALRTSARVLSIDDWLAGQSPPLERVTEHSLPWPREQRPRGGVRLLELQALCPFRAFAELRLQAAPPSAIEPGIAATTRGSMLHQALAEFWRQLGDSAALRARGLDSAMALATVCAHRAVEAVLARGWSDVPQTLRVGEQARIERLMRSLIGWELTRPDFSVRLIEEQQHLPLAGTELAVRLDRVDRLHEGGDVVIDYKSGTAQTYRPDEARPTQPQLPAYALTLGPQVVAVAMAHLTAEGLTLRGVADTDGRLPGLRNPRSQHEWPQLLPLWHTQLQGLMQEFLDGRATVDPASGACRYCALSSVCRVDAERQR